MPRTIQAVEPLEDRIPLSGSQPLDVFMDQDGAIGNDLAIQVNINDFFDPVDDTIEVVNSTTGEVVQSVWLAQLRSRQINVTGTAGDDGLRIEDSVLDRVSVLFEGNGGEDSVQGPDAGVSWALESTRPAETSADITIVGGADLTGGAGPDTLIGSDADAVWNLNSAGEGDVNGVTFTGFEALHGGTGEDNLGINLAATFNIIASLNGMMTVGFVTTGSPTAFLVPGGMLNLGVTATAILDSAAIDPGFMDASINNGSASFAGTLKITLDDPNSDGRVTLTELTDSSAAALSTLTINPVQSFIVTGTVDVNAGVDVPDGIGGLVGLLDADFDIALTGSIFGDSTSAAGFAPTDISLNKLIGGNTIDLLNFSNISPREILGMLSQLADTLLALSGSDLLGTEVPFSGKTIGDILGFATSFKTEVLDPLFASGDSLVPDSNGDGEIDDSDLTFGSIQELLDRLQAELSEALSLPGGTELKAAYDPGTNELTFGIAFMSAVGFGEAKITTLQGGGTGNEVQKLEINAVDSGGELADTYRLGFPDENGNLQFTDPIAYNAIASVIKDKLDDLTNIGAGDIAVTADGDAFQIEFTGALGNQNITQLTTDATQLAGAFSLNFGASLGDLAGVQTEGDLTILANLQAGLTFGIDPDPSQALQASPAVFQPGAKADVTTLQQGDGSNNEVQRVLIQNASGGDFTLTFDGQTTPTSPTTRAGRPS